MAFKDDYEPLKRQYDELIDQRIELLASSDPGQLIAGGLAFREREAELVFKMNEIKVKYSMSGADKTMKAPRKTRIRQCEEQTQLNETRSIIPNTTGGT